MKAKALVKWPGGKDRLVPVLLEHMPTSWGRYYEPFMGGAALYRALHSQKRLSRERALLGDLNETLVAAYWWVANEPAIIAGEMKVLARADYYHLREQFNAARSQQPVSAFTVSAFLVLNRRCFNGLYRENKNGEFNVPEGTYKTITYPDPFEQQATWQGAIIQHRGYQDLTASAGGGDFVYFDPPYLGTFSQYRGAGFGIEQHVELAKTVRDLDRRGVLWMLSNSDTPETRELYKGFRIDTVSAPMSISRGARKPRTELLVRNY